MCQPCISTRTMTFFRKRIHHRKRHFVNHLVTSCELQMVFDNINSSRAACRRYNSGNVGWGGAVLQPKTWIYTTTGSLVSLCASARLPVISCACDFTSLPQDRPKRWFINIEQASCSWIPPPQRNEGSKEKAYSFNSAQHISTKFWFASLLCGVGMSEHLFYLRFARLRIENIFFKC